MFFDPTSATAAVGAAQLELDRALECLAAAHPAPWAGPAADRFAAARDAAVVTGHAVERELRGARVALRAFEHECVAWTGLPRGWL